MQQIDPQTASAPQPRAVRDPEIALALADFRAGRPIFVADSLDRENEVDAIIAAECATPANVGWMVRHTSGYLCAPLPAQRADELDLPPMVAENQDPKRTAYTVACDAAEGTTTGISAADRARTLRVLANPATRPSDLLRPGHMLPLRACPGGVRERAGHTEAAVELCRLAGLYPVAAIGELVHDDGSMMRVRDAIKLAAENGLHLITIAQLIAELNAADAAANDAGTTGGGTAQSEAVSSEPPASTQAFAAAAINRRNRVSFITSAKLPTLHGDFRVDAFRDNVSGVTHLAIIAQRGDTSGAPLVRIHSECLTGEAFGSLRCDCGPQLQTALDTIDREGGVVVYLRGHEGRGIGLGEKIRAYSLQDEGLDTAAANEALGWPVDARDYGAAAAILAQIGINQVRLLTNNPQKAQLAPELVKVVETVPLEVGFDPHNADYLHTKQLLGHTFKSLDAYLDSLPAQADSAGSEERNK